MSIFYSWNSQLWVKVLYAIQNSHPTNVWAIKYEIAFTIIHLFVGSSIRHTFCEIADRAAKNICEAHEISLSSAALFSREIYVFSIGFNKILHIMKVSHTESSKSRYDSYTMSKFDKRNTSTYLVRTDENRRWAAGYSTSRLDFSYVALFDHRDTKACATNSSDYYTFEAPSCQQCNIAILSLNTPSWGRRIWTETSDTQTTKWG